MNIFRKLLRLFERKTVVYITEAIAHGKVKRDSIELTYMYFNRERSETSYPDVQKVSKELIDIFSLDTSFKSDGNIIVHCYVNHEYKPFWKG